MMGSRKVIPGRHLCKLERGVVSGCFVAVGNEAELADEAAVDTVDRLALLV